MEKMLLKEDSKGRITLPKNFRKKYKSKEYVVIENFGVLRIVPKGSFRDLRGLTPGIKVEGIRDETDRFDRYIRSSGILSRLRKGQKT